MLLNIFIKWSNIETYVETILTNNLDLGFLTFFFIVNGFNGFTYTPHKYLELYKHVKS